MQFHSLVNLLVVHGFLLVSCDIVEFEKFVPPTGPLGRQPILLDGDGGYTNLLVAIHRDVEESSLIIDGIKEIFTMTSRLLYNRTGRNLYFKSVSILIPDSWNEPSNYERSQPNETFQTARIIIRDETSEGLPPSCAFVRQLHSSGSEAEYMYLPSGMLTYRNESLKNKSAELLLSLWDGLLCGLKETHTWTSEQSGSSSITSCERFSKEKMKNSSEVKHRQSDVSTNFRILRHSAILSVIILDERLTMKENSTLGRIEEACKNYVWNLFPTYSHVGVVVLRDTGRKIVVLMKLTGPTSRKGFCDSDHGDFKNMTSSLEGAVMKAKKMISEARKNVSGSFIFIMSDATHISPALNETLQNVTSEGIVIASMPFSSNASENIDLGNTINTNFTVDDTNGLHQFEDETKFVRHYRSNFHLQPYEWINVTLSMEDASYMDYTILRIRVNDPSDWQYLYFQYDQEEDLPYQVDEFPPFIDDIFNVTIRDVEIDENRIQNLELMSNISQNVSLEIFSAMLYVDSYNNEAIHVRTSLKSRVVNFTAFNGSVPLYVSVTKNENPVLQVASVTAIVTNSDGSISTLQMNDDGIGADLESQDGIASVFFNSFTTEGEYEVQIDVHGGDEPCLSNSICSSESNTTNCTLLAPFQRFPNSISFTVIGIPPSKVTDLEAEITNNSTRSVLLSWTAVGEDMKIGKADRYEIRCSEKESDIAENFDNATLMENNGIEENNGSSKNNGRISQNQIIANKSGNVFFLAIRAIDRHGNKGDMSNVVPVKFPEDSESCVRKVFGVDFDIFVISISVLIGCVVIISLLLIARGKYSKRHRNRVLSEVSLDPVLRQSNHDSTAEGLTLVSI